MLDIALRWNNALGYADLVLNGPDLLTDVGLETSVIISLFTDAPAQPGDVIPDGTANRRGYWGDVPIAGQGETGKIYRMGSRLWLLLRAVQVQETLNRAESYAKEALQWMLDDGVVGSLTAIASFPQRGWLKLVIVLRQAGAAQQFEFAWQATGTT